MYFFFKISRQAVYLCVCYNFPVDCSCFSGWARIAQALRSVAKKKNGESIRKTFESLKAAVIVKQFYNTKIVIFFLIKIFIN